MRVGIIGLGVVGNANKKGFETLDHEVSFHDIKLNTKLEDVLNTSAVFICVPTPSLEDGGCDTSILESVIHDLHELNYAGIIAIRSTAVPGFTQTMVEKYSNNSICFVPEFLRERCAVEDFIKNHNVLAIGTNNDYVYETISSIHGFLPKQTVRLSPTEAELLKYFNNVYASLRIVFANVFFEASKKLNCDYDAIKNAYIKTGKALDMYLDVSDSLRGYGGMCLPKDTKAFAKLLIDNNLDFKIIESINDDNDKFKKTVYNGMRI
ncbi:MAG: UDP-glucose/GDP-mannose dehydrogenase family protein [Proteobacteria bacterium]|nr:UDP-glucose/GDP-mannose dehydrogenase family protein [Pseudomonadota bacterium]